MRGMYGLLLAGVACWPEPPGPLGPGEPAASVVLLRRVPEGVVPPDAPVLVSWPSTFGLREPPLVEAGGFGLEVEPRSLEAGVELLPLPRWPEGATVAVDLAGRLEAMDGSRPEVSVVQFPVARSRTEVLVGPPVVRRPVPGTSGPANLVWISVSGVADGASLELRAPNGDALLGEAERDEAVARVFRLSGSTCGRACPGQIYELVRPPGAPSGPLGQVRVSTAADLRPPSILGALVTAVPGELVVELEADEVVRGSGEWASPGGEGQLERMGEPGPMLRLRAVPPPAEGDRADLVVRLEDLAGNVTTATTSAQMPPALDVRISELVPTPRSDWGDSVPNGEPFDLFPGSGAVSSADEWVELVHHGSEALAVERLDLELRAIDGSPATTALVSAPALRFGDGGSLGAWAPGEALVVRTRGDMAQRDLRLELWAGALLLDAVVLGRTPDADHAGGPPPDLRHEALARGADGVLRWCRPTPGDPTPSTACVRE